MIARVLATDETPPPDVYDDEVLLLKRHDVVVGCGTGDAGTGGDASVDATPADAPADAGLVDAGVDGGLDGGPTDAGPGCTMIPGDAVTMVVAPRVHADAMGQRFAMLYVTPSRPVVEAFADAFGSLPSITAPAIVVHEVEIVDPALGTECAQEDYGCGGGGGGGGCESGTWDPPDYGGDDTTAPDDGGVSLQTIGPYEILRAQPRDRAELVSWLDQLGFTYEPSDIDAVVPYIARNYHVVAVRLAANQLDTRTTSLALTWAGSALTVPAALNASTHAGSPLTLYVAADGTYSFSGGKIVFSGRISMSGMGMGTTYVTRSEVTLPATGNPDNDPVAVRILPDVEYRETLEQTHYTHVPATVDCYDEAPPPEMDRGGCCSDCNAHRRVRVDMIVLALAVMFVLRRRRR